MSGRLALLACIVVMMLATVSSSVAEESLEGCLKKNLANVNVNVPITVIKQNGEQLQGRLVTASLDDNYLNLLDPSQSDRTAVRITFDEMERVTLTIRAKHRNDWWIPVGVAAGATLGALIGSKADSDTGGKKGTLIGAAALGGIGLVFGLAVGISHVDQVVECRR